MKMGDDTSRDAKLGVLEQIKKFMQHLDDQALTAKLGGGEGKDASPSDVDGSGAPTDDAGVATRDPVEGARGADAADGDEVAGEVEAEEPVEEEVAEGDVAPLEAAEGEPSDDEKLKALVKKRLGAR